MKSFPQRCCLLPYCSLGLLSSLFMYPRHCTKLYPVSLSTPVNTWRMKAILEFECFQLMQEFALRCAILKSRLELQVSTLDGRSIIKASDLSTSVYYKAC
jgi:hypothetical protein